LRKRLSAHRQLLSVVLLPVFLLFGCSTSARLRSSFGKKYRYSLSMVAPAKSSDLLFRDGRLIIQFRFDDPAIRFQAQNISPDTMWIEWGKASLDLLGSSTSVRNLLTFYDSSSAVSVGPPIPPMGVIRDVILPSGNVSFDGRQWQERDLLPTTDDNSPALRDSILNMAGASIDLTLPAAFGSDVHSYHFTFSIDSVKQTAWDDSRVPAWLPTRPPARSLKPTAGDQITAAILASSFLGFFTYLLTAKKTPVVE
jgi:hypothetical protein